MNTKDKIKQMEKEEKNLNRLYPTRKIMNQIDKMNIDRLEEIEAKLSAYKEATKDRLEDEKRDTEQSLREIDVRYPEDFINWFKNSKKERLKQINKELEDLK